MFSIFKRRVNPAQVIQVVDGRVNVTLSVHQTAGNGGSHVTRCKLHVLPKKGSKLYIHDETSQRDGSSGHALVREVYPCILTGGEVHYMVKCAMVTYDRDFRSKRKDPHGVKRK